MKKFGMELVTKDGQPVNAGDVVTDFRGDKSVVTDGTPPHKEGSTGRVYVAEEGRMFSAGFFPSVFDLEWRRIA